MQQIGEINHTDKYTKAFPIITIEKVRMFCKDVPREVLLLYLAELLHVNRLHHFLAVSYRRLLKSLT